MDKSLGERKHSILIKAIEDYIADACPITSKRVQSKHLKEVSSATLRNELNALEAMGFLKQLHTSSGRVPTSAGYRYYVNHLLSITKLDAKNLETVHGLIERRTGSISEIISSIASLVSKATNLPTVIVMNGYDKLSLDEISIVPLIANETMLLLKTKQGVVHTTLKTQSTQKACEDAGYFLTKKFKDKTIGYLLDNISFDNLQFQEEIKGFENVVTMVIDSLKNLAETGTMNIRTQGSAKLLTEAKDSLKQTKNLLNLLEDEQALKDIVNSPDDDKEISIVMTDSDEDNMCGCAMVKAPIIIDGQKVASVGVLGPERMDYASIASALRLVMTEMNDMQKLENKGDRDG